MNADLFFNANRDPNMNFKWMLYHGGNWFCIMRPCMHCVSKHLECCFIRKNNFFPVVIQMVTCLRQVDILRFLGQERDFSWKNRNITKVLELATYCTFTDLEVRIIFFQFGLQFTCCSEMIVLQDFSNMAALVQNQFSQAARRVINANITSFA